MTLLPHRRGSLALRIFRDCHMAIATKSHRMGLRGRCHGLPTVFQHARVALTAYQPETSLPPWDGMDIDLNRTGNDTIRPRCLCSPQNAEGESGVGRHGGRNSCDWIIQNGKCRSVVHTERLEHTHDKDLPEVILQHFLTSAPALHPGGHQRKGRMRGVRRAVGKAGK